jgi:DNA repair exonuclease SbcCD ATPase subunit
VKAAPAALRQQFELSMQAYAGMGRSREALESVRKLRAQLKDLRARTTQQGDLATALAALDERAAAIESGGAGGAAPSANNANANKTLARVNSAMRSLLDLLQDADAQPTTQAVAASAEWQRTLDEVLARWTELKSKDVASLNAQLRAANLPPLSVEP